MSASPSSFAAAAKSSSSSSWRASTKNKNPPPSMQVQDIPLPEGANPTTGQWEDRENLPLLQSLVKNNPVLSKISQMGAKAPKKECFPGDGGEYFYQYLQGFPDGTWALPQVFCRVIKGLNSNHWLALAAMRYRERRHLIQDTAYGNLKPAEVQRLLDTNAAFFHHYVQIRPSEAQLQRLRQRHAARIKGEKRKSIDTTQTTTTSTSTTSSSSTTTTTSEDPALKERAVPLKKRRVALVDDTIHTKQHTTSNNKKPTTKATAADQPMPSVTPQQERADLLPKLPNIDKPWNTNQGGQFVDRNNLQQLQELVELNPVLGYIQQVGGKSPKRLLFPQDATCEYFYEYLESFPAGTWALPQVFCRVIKGLNSNHWLALAAARFRDRRHHGQGPYGSLRPQEVERLQQVNAAFYCHYVCQAPGTNPSEEPSRSVPAKARSTVPHDDQEDDDDEAEQESVEEEVYEAQEFKKMSASDSSTMSPPSLLIPPPVMPQQDSLLQSQILRDHLLRAAGFVQQQPHRPSLLYYPTSAPAPPAASSSSSLYQDILARTLLPGGLGFLPNRDALPFLADNLGVLSSNNAAPQTSATTPEGSMDTFQALASLLSSANALSVSSSTSKQLPEVVGTSMHMMTQPCWNQLSNAVVTPTGAAEKQASLVSQAKSDDDDETLSSSAARPSGGDWSMLDILAATASAARTGAD